MKETILLFNIQDRQKALKIEMALFPLHVRLRRIKPEDYGHTLGYLAGLKSAETETTMETSDTETNGADTKTPKNAPNSSATLPELDSEMGEFPNIYGAFCAISRPAAEDGRKKEKNCLHRCFERPRLS